MACRVPGIFLVAFTLLSLVFTGPAAGKEAIADLDLGFSLPVPEDAASQRYLGLGSTQDAFTLEQVQADILIVEIFSMYCPICQREAPRVNALYEKLMAVKGKKIRLLGIGAGNSPFEVAFFKETYAIPFPVFSDADFHIHKKIGERGTPFFIGMTPGLPGLPGLPPEKQVFFTHSGDMKDLDEFFNQLMTAADKALQGR